MTKTQEPRPGQGTRSENPTTYIEGTPGFEERDQALKLLRKNGFEPYTNDWNSHNWFVRCPIHESSNVRIASGKRMEVICLPTRGEPCATDSLIEKFGLGEMVVTRKSVLDQLRAALVDSAGLDNIEPPTPLIEGVLQLDSIAWLQGKPGHGKSFIGLDMAGCVGTGNVWQGFPVKQGLVLYMAAEGVSGVRQRVRAWEHSMGEAMANVQFLPEAVQSSVDGRWTAFVDLAAELNPVLVIIDTQARVTVGLEENSAKDMGVFVDRVEQVRKATGACVLVIHHEGRAGEHMRGSTAIEGAATTIIRAKKEGEDVTVECVKQKDAMAFDTLDLRLVSTDLSAVVCLTDPMRRSTVLTGQDEKLVSVWRETYETDLVSVSALMDVSGIPKATVNRAVKKLVKQGLALQGGTSSRRLYQLK